MVVLLLLCASLLCACCGYLAGRLQAERRWRGQLLRAEHRALHAALQARHLRRLLSVVAAVVQEGEKDVDV